MLGDFFFKPSLPIKCTVQKKNLFWIHKNLLSTRVPISLRRSGVGQEAEVSKGLGPRADLEFEKGVQTAWCIITYNPLHVFLPVVTLYDTMLSL